MQPPVPGFMGNKAWLNLGRGLVILQIVAFERKVMKLLGTSLKLLTLEVLSIIIITIIKL